MTENEAIKEFQQNIDMPFGSNISREASGLAIQALEKVQQYRAIGTPEELKDMRSDYFEVLSDWRQYRKIGTLEECQAALEKRIPKKPIENDTNSFDCPCCKYDLKTDTGNPFGDYFLRYCDNCGQMIDWSDEI